MLTSINVQRNFKKKIYWSIVGLQRCVNFCSIAKWFSYIYTYILFHYGLSQDTDYSSLSYTVRPCYSEKLLKNCPDPSNPLCKPAGPATTPSPTLGPTTAPALRSRSAPPRQALCGRSAPARRRLRPLEAAGAGPMGGAEGGATPATWWGRGIRALELPRGPRTSGDSAPLVMDIRVRHRRATVLGTLRTWILRLWIDCEMTWRRVGHLAATRRNNPARALRVV